MLQRRGAHAFESLCLQDRGVHVRDDVMAAQEPTNPLRIAYTVSSELFANPSFSSTRAR